MGVLFLSSLVKCFQSLQRLFRTEILDLTSSNPGWSRYMLQSWNRVPKRTFLTKPLQTSQGCVCVRGGDYVGLLWRIDCSQTSACICKTHSNTSQWVVKFLCRRNGISRSKVLHDHDLFLVDVSAPQKQYLAPPPLQSPQFALDTPGTPAPLIEPPPLEFSIKTDPRPPGASDSPFFPLPEQKKK